MTLKFLVSLKRDLSQYGFVPSKVMARFVQQVPPPVLANSIPKSGTNLLTRLLYSHPCYRRKLANTLTNQPDVEIQRKLKRLSRGEFRPAHIYFSDERASIIRKTPIKHIFIIRDPRDIVVSNVNYITRQAKTHRLHDYFVNALASDAERRAASIVGIPARNLPDETASLGIGEHLSNYRGWLRDSNTLIVKFEDLIGPSGGGSTHRQQQSITKVFQWLDVEHSRDSVNVFANRLFSQDSRTFFRGESGVWRTVFTDSDIALFKEFAGNTLIEMGYEEDESW